MNFITDYTSYPMYQYLNYINDYYNYYNLNSDRYNDYTRFELYDNRSMNIRLFQNTNYLYYFIILSCIFGLKKIKTNILTNIFSYLILNHAKNYYFYNYENNNIITKIFITNIIRSIFMSYYMTYNHTLINIIKLFRNIKINNSSIQYTKNILLKCIQYYFYLNLNYMLFINLKYSMSFFIYHYKVMFFLEHIENTSITLVLLLYFQFFLSAIVICTFTLLILKCLFTLIQYINLIRTSYSTMFSTFMMYYNLINNNRTNNSSSTNNNETSNSNTSSNTTNNTNNLINQVLQSIMEQDTNRTINNKIMDKQIKVKYTKLSIDEVHKKLDDVNNDKCIICFENDIDTILNICNHNCICLDCAHKLSSCPICRESSFDTIYYY